MNLANREIGSTIKAFCSSCRGRRNCEIKGYHKESWSDLEENFHWSTEWFLLTCKGCEHVFAQTTSSDSESYTYDHRGDVISMETVRTWPAQSKRERPKWFEHGHIESNFADTHELESVLQELYGALNEDLSVLSAIGIRTSFDMAAGVLGVDSGKTFSEKLKDLVEQSHILETTKEQLETLIDAGGASAHRGWRPRPADLNTLMDILEEFIYSALILPRKKSDDAKKIAALKDRVPAKQSRAKKK